VSLLDDVLPEWDARERHEVAVDAPPERALAAARAVRLRDVPAVALLLRLRGISRRPREETFLGAMLGAGFEVAAEEPGREVVLAAVGRPWRLAEPLRRDADVRTFAEPGWARMAMTVRAEPGRLVTETRVLATDDESRRRFRRYWRVVAPFSGLTRRLLLRAAKRAAERERR
jgi:hypothetical protein